MRWQQGGIIVRELHTTNTVAIGSDTDPVMNLKVWHNNGAGIKEVASEVFAKGGKTLNDYFANPPDFAAKYDVYLRIDVEGLVAQSYFSEDNAHWTPLGPTYFISWQDGCFTTFHPGLFSGETVVSPSERYADFDYFHMENHERF